MTVVLITGGRTYFNENRVYQVLDAAVERLGLTSIIHGDADGDVGTRDMVRRAKKAGLRVIFIDWDG